MKNMITNRKKWMLAAVFALASGFCYSCGGDGSEKDAGAGIALVEELDGGGGSQEAAKGSGAPGSQGAPESGGTPESQEAAVCYVHICGQVSHPGVYKMEEGQRIYEAIEQAGGFTPEAADDWLNLAETVQDGMKLEVPGREEAEALRNSGFSPGGAYVSGFQGGTPAGKPVLININTASREELMTLNGIGESKAADIIRYRQEHGGFKSIEEIMKIPGIKDGAFQKIKDEITV